MAAIAGGSDDVAPEDSDAAASDRSVVNGDRTPGGDADPRKSDGYLRPPELSRLADAFLGAAES